MHSQEKRHAFKLRLDAGASVPEASYTEGISSSTGYRWRDQFRHQELEVRHEALKARHGKLQAQYEDAKVENRSLRRRNNALEAENWRLRSRNRVRAVVRWLANAFGAGIFGEVLGAVLNGLTTSANPSSS